MRSFFLFSFFLLSTFSAFAQMTFPGKANQHSIYGGEDGKNFGAYFSTDCPSRVEAIGKIIDFLCAYDFVENKEQVMKSLSEFDDTQTTFTIPVTFRFGWHGTAPVMGAVAPLPPVYLNANLQFSFFDNGQVLAVIRNFSNKAFTNYATASKSRLKEGLTAESILTPEEAERYLGYVQAPTLQAGMGKAITAFLVFANSGADKVQGINEALADFLKDIDDQIEIAKKLTKGGFYIYGTPEEALAKYRGLIENDDLNYAPSIIDRFEKEIAEERLVYVYERFWTRDIKQEFDYVFLAISAFLNGPIIGIAEDGVDTWALDGDKLLPTDSKLKKKLVKEGRDYYSYYGD